ncbi:putative ribonuclease H-like domain-containing protein [Tanacetum coccineum]
MVEKPVWNNASWVNHQNSQRLTHPHPKGNFVPKAVLIKSGHKTLNTARQNSSKAAVSVNTARPINTAYLRPIMNSARTVSNVFNRAHSHVRRPFNKFTTNKNSNLNEKVNTVRRNVTTVGSKAVGNPQLELQEKGVIDSGCSRHMNGTSPTSQIMKKLMVDLLPLEEIPKEVKSLVKVKSVQKNSVLFTDTECVVLSPDFKLLDENHVLLRVPRKDNMYSVDLKNIVPSGGLTCLFAKATLDESNLWHRRLGHINFKTMNKLVRGNLVRGLPSKIFENNHTCVACQKGKQHKASCKTKTVSSISQPLQMLHMDLFGPTFVKSLMKKMYCLVVTDDYSRFSWVFFLATKDETSEILKTFITGIENLIDLKVKVIRCDNGTEFKNKVMNQFCEMKGRKPALSFMRSFGCPDTILNTIDHLGKFDGKADAGFFVDLYNNKAFQGNQSNGIAMYNIMLKMQVPNIEELRVNQEQDANVNNTNNINTVSPTVNVADIKNNVVDENIVYGCVDDPNMPNLVEIVYSDDDEGFDAKADMTDLDAHILVYRNKKYERGIVIKNKARLVAQGYTQEEGIDYDEVFALVARIEAIRLFLAYASFKDIIVYQMDVESAFLYGKIKNDVYVYQPPGFEDPEFSNKVYKMSSMGELTFFLGLQVTQKDDGIFISQDKYVDVILKKFGFSTVKTTSTPMETSKPLLKDVEAEDVDVHLYRSMIRSLIYLKGQPKLGLWYPKDSPFDLKAYTDSDYAGASLDKKSTTGGCQFLRRRLISWQCKKQTIVANSTTEVEYVAASSYYGQVLWIQNQMLDYGYNFMNTKIFIDNESTICIVKHPVFQSKTKHIEIRHHFIRDSYEKRLIQVIKIHTDHNVVNLLIKSSRPIPLAVDEIVIKEWEDIMERAATTASSLEAEQDINGERQIQALVDKKKVIIIEISIRSDLKLEDAEGTDYLPTATIFAESERMGYENLTQKLTFYKAYFSSQRKFLIRTILQCLSAKTTAWNEFSSTMASAIICLATNQKFNFSKYIFDNMVKNLEGGVKFLMYPRYVQVFLDNEVEGMTKHKGIYVTPSHTKKVFANMNRLRKGFSGKVAPLFQTMMVQALEDMGEDSADPTDSHSTPIITQPSSSKP